MEVMKVKLINTYPKYLNFNFIINLELDYININLKRIRLMNKS